jgi:galactose oxidase
MAPMAVGRQYHSVSLLLADGRVLNIGSQSAFARDMRMEVYSPPYLFRGPRPQIGAAPASVGYGAEFSVESPDACRIDRVVFLRPSSITHHTNPDQRYLPLAWHRDGHCGLRATAPADGSVAPPGYYLLFILDDCGVPSVGRFVRLG